MSVIETVVPLNIATDVGIVELQAPITNLSIELNALRGAKGEQGEQGEPGPQGEQGPQGEPGAAGSAPQAYHHSQGTPSDTWTITHNLGYRPAGIHVEDSGGNDHDPADVEYPDIYSVILHFSFAFGGTADIS